MTCELCRQPVLSFCKNHFALNVLSTKERECSACSEKFPLDSALRHVERCTSTDITCDLCHETLRRVDQGTHVQVCLMVEINCECGEKLQRREEAVHKDSMCALRKVACPLKCGEMVKRYAEFIIFVITRTGYQSATFLSLLCIEDLVSIKLQTIICFNFFGE